MHINFYQNYQLWIRPWRIKILPKLLLIFAPNMSRNSPSSKINNFDQPNHLPSTEVQQSTKRLNPERVIREKSCEKPHPLDPSSRRNSLVQIHLFISEDASRSRLRQTPVVSYYFVDFARTSPTQSWSRSRDLIILKRPANQRNENDSSCALLPPCLVFLQPGGSLEDEQRV